MNRPETATDRYKKHGISRNLDKTKERQIPSSLEESSDFSLIKEIIHRLFPNVLDCKKILQQLLEDIEDYIDGEKAYEEFLVSGEKAIPWEEVKRKSQELKHQGK